MTGEAAIPLAGRFRPREVLPEGTKIAQVLHLYFLSDYLPGIRHR